MKNSDNIVRAWVIIMIIMVFSVFFHIAYAHDTKQEQENEKIVSKQTEIQHDKIMLLEREIKALQGEIKRIEQSHQRNEKAHTELQRAVKQASSKPKPKPKAKPPRKPRFKLHWQKNRYWLQNLSDFSIRCEIEAISKEDDDRTVTLLKKQEMGYKLKFNEPPSIKCREI